MGQLGAVRSLLLGSVATAMLWAMPVAAQRPGASVTADQGDEIIVTATRREERLQDVPVAVTAISARELGQSGLKEATDIQYLAPNITFSSQNPVANGGGYQVRGIGTQTFDSGVEQTVGLVVDGVVIGLSRDPGVTGFADIERIEVLRGPQGTLFGKNASAGVIQIVTRKPRLGESSLDLSFSLGERSDQVQRATGNLPIGDTAALRVTAFRTAQRGAIPNIVNRTYVGDRENYGVRGRFLWEPSDTVSTLLTAEYQSAFARDAHTIESMGPETNPTVKAYIARFAGLPIQPGPGVFVAFNDGDWTSDQKLWSVQNELNIKAGDHLITSITAYRALKSEQLADIDAAPVDLFNHSDGGVDSNQFTQELRLTSPSGKALEYVFGLYYYRTHNAGWVLQYGKFGGQMPLVLAGGRREQINTVNSYAAFGNVTYALTDSVKVIGGLRYTNDRNHGTRTITRVTFPHFLLSNALPYDGTVKADNVSGRVGVQFQPDRDLMLYATFATGYKGPAIDGTNGIVSEVRPETVKSYELGLKSTLFDSRAIFNLSLYWSDFSDFQTTALDTNRTPAAFVFTNAGGMRARGVEVETSFRVMPGLTLAANGAYSDATYRDFFGPCYPGQPASAPGGGGCFLQPGTSGTMVSDYAGYALPNAPKWSYTLRASFDQPVGNDLRVDGGLNWAWRSATQVVLGDPKARVQAYGLLNGSIGIGSDNGSWRFGLYARNLFNKHFFAPYAATPTFNPGGYLRIMSPEAFRTIGATASFSF